MTLAEFLTMAAILLAPLVAIQVSWKLDQRRAKHQARLYVFRTLMGTRASPMEVDHIGALNAVDVEFYGSDERSKQVLEAHKIYFNHLNSSHDLPIETWDDKRKDLFLDLLAKMANSLGYKFDKSAIKTTSYVPIAYGDRETEHDLMRKGVINLLAGNIPLPVRIIKPPNNATDQKTH